MFSVRLYRRLKVLSMLKVSAYVDGYNFYHGIIDATKWNKNFGAKLAENNIDRPQDYWKQYLWLDLKVMIEKALSVDNNNIFLLNKINYFTSFVKGDDKKQYQQMQYLNALNTVQGLAVIEGRIISSSLKCPSCDHKFEICPNCGSTNLLYTKEKKTDVNIAISMISQINTYDVAILVSGDSDLAPALEYIRKQGKSIILLSPPNRVSKELRKCVTEGGTKYTRFNNFEIREALLKNSQFPDIIEIGNYEILKPKEWNWVGLQIVLSAEI